MILHQHLTFEAKSDKGQLFITDRSPDLPEFPERTALSMYLRWLSFMNFRVTRMEFDHFTLTARVESCGDQPQQLPLYLIHSLNQTLASTDQSGFPLASHLVNEQKQLNEILAGQIRAQGWRELAVSKPLADFSGGLVFLSVWIKE
jgi:hypothetical protein